jgi:hypothetical protein
LLVHVKEARMPTVTIEYTYTTEAERMALEQAMAFFTQMQHVAATAPDGTVLAACEQVALTDGRKLPRDTLASAVQARADASDAPPKKSGRARRDGGSVG